MNRLSALVILFAFVAHNAAGAEPAGVDSARKLLLHGKYAEAIDIDRPLAEKSPAAAIGLARCYEAQGKLDEAVRALAAVGEKNAEAQAELARIAFERGRLDEARSHADAAIKAAPGQVLAQFVLAEIARTTGRIEQAEQGYQRLIEYYNGHEIDKAETLHWIGRAAAQYARWNRLSDQFDFLVNDLYPDALKAEAGYWPANYESGLLFAEKYNRADATEQFKAALELNPCAAEVHAATAALAMESHDFDRAERSLKRALKINPRLLDAWLLKSDLAWANLQADQSLELLQAKALPLNAIHEPTLARIAACYLLLDGPPAAGKPSRFTRLVAEVTQRNVHAGEFFQTLAEMLEARNKQPEAETYFREAIRVMPRQVGPHAGLGMLYMRTGQETDARRLLDEAFKADPFHVRVKNMLEVLDVLKAMQTTTTEHFTIRFDKRDKVLARYAAKHLEATYSEMCKEFGYQPPNKTVVEVFNQAEGGDGHSWFSARMTGLPYLGTVAASTGRIVAMASPNESGAPRRFNWARVLRHEMVHIFTLQQTQFNIPHWFTEGLAVRSERCARPYQWNQVLRQRVADGKLFRLDTINMAFTRPSSGEDWQMAYFQSLLYVDYMVSRGGPESLSKMLSAYTENPSTDVAIRRVFGISQGDFEQGYVEYVKKIAAAHSEMSEPPTAEIADLLKASRARPNDADAAARLALGYLKRGLKKESLEAAKTALRLKPKHPLATYVVARQKTDRPEEAIGMLEACLDRKKPDPLVLGLLAGLKLKAKKYDEAASLYALAERLDSGNPKWTTALAKVYLLTENKTALADALVRLAQADGDDLPSRKKLAELSLARHDTAAAVKWACQAMEINIADAEVHRLLAAALVEQGEYEPAIEEFETAIELNPSHLQQRFALADACVQAKQPAKARKVLEALLKREPKYPGADVLLKSLKGG